MAAGVATSDGALRTLTGHANWVPSVCTTPDCQHVISGSSDETVRVWSLASGKLVHTLNGHTGAAVGASAPAQRRKSTGILTI